MTVQQPTDKQVYEIAEQLGMNVDEAKAKAVARQFSDLAGYPLHLAP